MFDAKPQSDFLPERSRFFNATVSFAMAGCRGLGGVFERYAHVQPERPAVVDPEGEWTYQELGEITDQKQS